VRGVVARRVVERRSVVEAFTVVSVQLISRSVDRRSQRQPAAARRAACGFPRGADRARSVSLSSLPCRSQAEQQAWQATGPARWCLVERATYACLTGG
jgi:hypothetical protein